MGSSSALLEICVSRFWRDLLEVLVRRPCEEPGEILDLVQVLVGRCGGDFPSKRFLHEDLAMRPGSLHEGPENALPFERLYESFDGVLLRSCMNRQRLLRSLWKKVFWGTWRHPL